ncbi:MAG: DinB family protein, partial [Chloroflexi bacterium]|nr:DinB family protein [Chloroflexota bacterium]
KAMRQAAEFTTFADLQTAWMRVESEMKDFLVTCTEKALTEPVTYTNTRGEKRSMPLGQLMLHVANHGTHHRGELAAILAVLNVPHPEDDMLLYFREKP